MTVYRSFRDLKSISDVFRSLRRRKALGFFRGTRCQNRIRWILNKIVYHRIIPYYEYVSSNYLGHHPPNHHLICFVAPVRCSRGNEAAISAGKTSLEAAQEAERTTPRSVPHA